MKTRESEDSLAIQHGYIKGKTLSGQLSSQLGVISDKGESDLRELNVPDWSFCEPIKVLLCYRMAPNYPLFTW